MFETHFQRIFKGRYVTDFKLSVAYTGFRISVAYTRFRNSIAYTRFRISVAYTRFRNSIAYTRFRISVTYTRVEMISKLFTHRALFTRWKVKGFKGNGRTRGGASVHGLPLTRAPPQEERHAVGGGEAAQLILYIWWYVEKKAWILDLGGSTFKVFHYLF